MRVDGPNDMLVKADRLAHQARRAVLDEYVTDAVARRIIARAMSHPTWRPMFELGLNGCTSHRSTCFLVSDGLAETGTFETDAQGFRGRQCECLELTSSGTEAFQAEQARLERIPSLGPLRGALVGYCCIDDGQGICATRRFLQTALELPDPDILERVVRAESGEKQFPEAAASRKRIDDEERTKSSHWWSAIEGSARSGLIVDLEDG